MFAFAGTGLGRLTTEGGAFQSCASSVLLIENAASKISALDQLAAEYRDFINFSNFELLKIYSAADFLRFCNRRSCLPAPLA